MLCTLQVRIRRQLIHLAQFLMTSSTVKLIPTGVRTTTARATTSCGLVRNIALNLGLTKVSLIIQLISINPGSLFLRLLARTRSLCDEILALGCSRGSRTTIGRLWSSSLSQAGLYLLLWLERWRHGVEFFVHPLIFSFFNLYKIIVFVTRVSKQIIEGSWVTYHKRHSWIVHRLLSAMMTCHLGLDRIRMLVFFARATS